MIRYEMKKNIKLIGYGVLGLVEGGIISVISQPISLWLILLFLLLWPISILRSASSVERIGHFIKIGIGVFTVVLAIFLPVKQLDGRVGPMHYERMSLYDLSRRLSKDWSIRIMPYDLNLDNTFLTFGTDKRMSRLKVLQKLAKETDSDLRIMYCGTGATFLFGASPSFTTLRPRKAQ
ncbi:MAG: hypothetical protein HY753_06985 [Nitrospirae bacterium]|nr:hypothetical protein [Nitrospirota bacterium]